MEIVPPCSRTFHIVPLYSTFDMNPTFALPGVKHIAFIDASLLPESLGQLGIAGVPIYIMGQFTPVPFSGEPTCIGSRTNASVGSSQTVELTFQSRIELPEDKHLAFLVIDANDSSYLIGTHEDPHPLIESEQTFGVPDTDANTTTYTVRYTAPRALLSCICA